MLLKNNVELLIFNTPSKVICRSEQYPHFILLTHAGMAPSLHICSPEGMARCTATFLGDNGVTTKQDQKRPRAVVGEIRRLLTYSMMI